MTLLAFSFYKSSLNWSISSKPDWVNFLIMSITKKCQIKFIIFGRYVSFIINGHILFLCQNDIWSYQMSFWKEDMNVGKHKMLSKRLFKYFRGVLPDWRQNTLKLTESYMRSQTQRECRERYSQGRRQSDKDRLVEWGINTLKEETQQDTCEDNWQHHGGKLDGNTGIQTPLPELKGKQETDYENKLSDLTNPDRSICSC